MGPKKDITGELFDELKKKDLAPNEYGKGSNVLYCLGMCLARDEARSVALHDCDILTYERRLLAKLFYPVANPNFNFESEVCLIIFLIFEILVLSQATNIFFFFIIQNFKQIF